MINFLLILRVIGYLLVQKMKKKYGLKLVNYYLNYFELVEKAYAKLYGSYEKIVEGKVSFALNDLTICQMKQIRNY